MSFLTGKKAKSKSYNKEAGWVGETYKPMAETGVGSTNALASLLGVGGDSASASAAFDNYKNSAGYSSVMDSAMRGITGSAAARGLLGSGSTLKAMQSRAADIGSQYFNNYLGQLLGLSNLGLNAGNLVVGANQVNEQKGGTGGLFGALGGLGQGIGGFASLSDMRAKADIEKIGEEPDGLGLYRFRYLFSPVRYLGVIAQEVARLRPWALGPMVGDFHSVRYDLLEAA